MKWFKHISDSLDDPFIFELVKKFGSDGYLVFFGVLEIYSREFKPCPGWLLDVSLSYLRQKLHKRQGTVIEKCLEYIATHGKLTPNSRQTPDKLPANSSQTPGKLPANSKKVFKNSGKWDVAFDGEQIIIFIPKFTELIDEWTQRKLGSNSGVTRKILKHEVEEEVDIDNNTPLPPIEKKSPPAPKNKEEYTEDFEKFWSVYPNKKSGKANAFISWKKLNGRRPPVEQITAAIEKQKGSTDWIKDNGQFIPMATTWLNQKRWDAVMDIQVQPAAPKTSTLEEIRALKSIRG